MLPHTAGALPSAAAPSFKSPAEMESPTNSSVRGARASTAAPTYFPPETVTLGHGTDREKSFVFVDGGVRRGTDVVKYLALGADFVWVGLALIYGLAADGERGIAGVLSILADETKSAMQLLGACSVGDIKAEHARWPGVGEGWSA